MYKKFDVRKYSKGGAYRDDDYIFDKNGNFTGKIEVRKGPHRLAMPDENGQMQYYEFADQENDPNVIANLYRIGKGDKIKAIPKTKREVFRTIEQQGGFTKDYIEPKAFYDNSKGRQTFDYSNQVLGDDLKKNKSLPNSTFFLPEGDGYAHNTMNFGK